MGDGNIKQVVMPSFVHQSLNVVDHADRHSRALVSLLAFGAWYEKF